MVASKHVRAGHDLEERASDGNLALIRAVERFDFARGYRFSTYATWAIFNHLVLCGRGERRRTRWLASYRYGVVAAHSVSDRSEPDESLNERARRSSVCCGGWTGASAGSS